MEEVYDIIFYDRGLILGRGRMVRQIGEQLRLPSRAEITGCIRVKGNDGVIRWSDNRSSKSKADSYTKYVRSQVSGRDWRILQELDVNLDSRVLAEFWSEFVNFDARTRTETPFLLEQLTEYERPAVFDACLGSGATTIGLKLAGVKHIMSNEIDEGLFTAAKREARKRGVEIYVRKLDWRDLGKGLRKQFDVVTCLGNSLTYLFNSRDQLKSLRSFRAALKENGKLIIDERNYAGHFLGGDYRFSGEVVYTGNEAVSAHPIHISDSMVVMEYQHRETGTKAHLVLYPFKENELQRLLERAKFTDITVFGDYQRDFNPSQPEFLTYVCRK